MNTSAQILRGTPPTLARLARRLRAGDLVAVPTETVYGLAANALDARACRRIFTAKGRPADDPLIVHIHTLAQLSQVAEVNPAALKLAKKFWPGPLTLVLPKKSVVPAVVSAGLPSVAVRMPSHPLFRRLLKLAGVPLAAPSANPFGYVSPTSAEHVRAGLGSKIRYILDGGPCAIGLESTIVDLRDPVHPRLLRPGAVTQAELERVLGIKVRVAGKPTAVSSAQLAPGMLTRHYSPRTSLRLTSRPVGANRQTALIFLRKPAGESPAHVYWLSKHGARDEIARNLFRILRETDAGGYHEIQLEKLPATLGGLAAALHDRMKRAASKR